MSGKAPLLVVGDALLDRDLTGHAARLAPDAPVPVVDDYGEATRPGGAALTAYLAARDGREVTLVAGAGDDPASRELKRLLAPWVTLIPLPLSGPLPEKTRVLAADRPVARLDRGDGRAREATEEAREAVLAAPHVLVSDYGRGTADRLRDVLAARPPLVWDPHPRGGPPVPGTRLVTPAEKEAHAVVSADGIPRRDLAAVALADGAPRGDFAAVAPSDGIPRRDSAAVTSADGAPRRDLAAVTRSAATLVRQWRAGAVAVTLGARGALLSYGEHPLLVPAASVHHNDSCGAGDRFAATAAGLLADGALVGEAVEGAVAAATGFVAAGGAGAVPRPDTPPPRPADGDDPFALADRVRSAHGTVVAAGGCFDLLHAGHVGLLQAARELGDCLVVCVNSDASVRRRKGAGRPVNPLTDRVRVLRALACVDAVAVFDEDTPERLLSGLRPDVWVKGGDYAATDLPEAPLLEEWGGQAVLLPYLNGRSSTGLLTRAAEAPR
ncbi:MULTISPECIES: D-glycero-beta-D-manno-heptose 1-phosphate adenylyltransferase [unclassified Streptomyces]|uniref:D-glycero-beta-D-manno-heptose 1-phosphate adenylyltransferase n=1 Tax=unclassified Streptomyces TaxID=2593676 RepID=UPI00093E9AF9|nr:D-glycero-beta-D-manno-heptose 1-phosphate adenylyltransferase [Streptomyces sp. CB02400]OKK14206.1 D-beta-D-heptose 1-phosphate adenosyltransferase [Streptomyces sp. CB02400]